MGRSRLRTLLVTSVVIMLCAAMIVGGTYALFSDSVEVTNHLVAGTLKVKLERIDLEQWRLDEDGIVKKTELSEAEKTGDFTRGITANVFGMNETEAIAPSSKYSAKMRIANDGGSVAFDYKVYVTVDLSQSETDEELAKQIKVTVTDKNGVKRSEKTLWECADFEVANGRVLIGEAESGQDEFTVTVEFVNILSPEDGNNNDLAQGKKAKFDLLVVATQASEN